MGYLTMALGEQATNRRSYHVCAFTVRPAGETCAFSERWNGNAGRCVMAWRLTVNSPTIHWNLVPVEHSVITDYADT